MNKSALLKKAKAILNDNQLGTIFDHSSEDYTFLLRIFQGHPEYQIKSGAGIVNVFIGKGVEFNTRCFFITRIDGSTSDISYIRSINGATTKISDIKCACRSAIEAIVADVRKKVIFGVDICPISGDALTPDNTHIDHYNLTFEELFTLWIKLQNIDFLHSCLNDSTQDNAQKIYFTSNTIRKSFIEFHNCHTHLRAVTKTSNLSALRKKMNSSNKVL